MKLNKTANETGHTIKHGDITITPKNTKFGKIFQLLKTVVSSKLIPINGTA